MDREKIDRMWQQALHQSLAAGEQFTRYHFAALVAAAERETCIKACNDYRQDDGDGQHLALYAGVDGCIQAIRARSAS